ncbi:MAG: DUF4230 domain-containing protein [Oscillospiraceae bacterium]|jgi:hypothetical protein|nr:DUF4230 domain-containing protein [Oscillospiraceae bacterium]
MFCSKCGKAIKSNAEFCSSCGTVVEKEIENVTPPTVKQNNNTSRPSNNSRETFIPNNFSGIKKYVYVGVAVAIIIFVSIIAFNLGGFLRGNPLEVRNDTVVNITTLEHQIQSIGELATLQYYYRNLIIMEDSHKIFGWNIPLTQKSFIIHVDGIIKIGIDTSEINTNLSEHTKTITITIPGAKILSHELKEETMVILDESSGLFNPISIEDWGNRSVEEKRAAEEFVFNSDMFATAEEDAIRMLQALIGGIIPEGYTVIVKS